MAKKLEEVGYPFKLRAIVVDVMKKLRLRRASWGRDGRQSRAAVEEGNGEAHDRDIILGVTLAFSGVIDGAQRRLGANVRIEFRSLSRFLR
jgi:hypothetical protein